jgi:hypothetical protein
MNPRNFFAELAKTGSCGAESVGIEPELDRSALRVRGVKRLAWK